MATTTASEEQAQKAQRRINERQIQWKRVYEKWDMDAGRKLVFDAQPWLQAFQKASQHRDGDMLRALRVFILDGIRAACTPSDTGEFAYTLPDGTRMVFCDSKQKMIDQCAETKLHTFGGHPNWDELLEEPKEKFETVVEVVEGDCLEAAEKLIAQGMRPVVLNMASDHTPGGGYKGGAGAQEENLFRRTNLLRVLANEGRWYDPKGKGAVPPNKMYPLPDPSCMYTPSAFVLRGSEANGYPWLAQPYEVAFVASAAYRRPRLEKDNEHMLPKFAEGFLEKVRALLWTAAHYGHDSAVLSAWGCGAFRNPPKHIAELFKQVLAEPWIQGRFRNVTFAIFDDHNARKEHNPDGNVQPFIRVFGLDKAPPKKSKSPTASSSSPAPSSSSTAATSSSPTPSSSTEATEIPNVQTTQSNPSEETPSSNASSPAEAN
jgi:uncharacterized protein (TIGR02452 family)